MVYTVMLNDLIWDEKNWKRFQKFMKKRCRLVEFPACGCIELTDKQDRLSEYDVNVIVKGSLSEFLDQYLPIERYYPQKEFQKTLPIETHVIADTYLFLSLKLAVLQADQTASSVIDKYFLDIRLHYSEDYCHYYDFDESLAQMQSVEGIHYQKIEINTICGMIRGILDQNQYVAVHLDEYFISRKESYDTSHLVRENLIYGYDDQKRIFYAYGFGRREHTESFEISYDEMVISFEKGRLFYFRGAEYLKMDYCFPITMIQVRCNEMFQLTEAYLLHKMKTFLHPKPMEAEQGAIWLSGTAVYKWILDELKGVNEIYTVDYRTFYLLYEHKRNVLRCMEKLEAESRIFDAGTVKKYKEVVKGFQKIRLMYLKDAGVNEKILHTRKIHKIYEPDRKFIEAFETEIEREKELLGRIIEYS